MTDIVERLRQRPEHQEVFDHLNRPYGLDVSLEHQAADEIERLRRIIDTVHPQMQAHIDKLQAALVEAIERGNDWCDQAKKARASLRDLLEIEGWAQDHPRYIAARAVLSVKEPNHD